MLALCGAWRRRDEKAALETIERGAWGSRLSVFRGINERFNELYDGRDEPTLFGEVLSELPADKRELWEKEALFDLEHRSEYYELYDSPEDELEKDILRLFES